MASTYTTNKVIEKPGNGDYVDTWNVPANSDFDIIDQAFGSTTSLNATSGSATLTSTQYRSLFLSISGAMSAGVTYTIPSGVGGQWIIHNTTTDSSGGPWTVTIASGGGGASLVIPRNTRIIAVSNGTSIRPLAYLYADDSGNVTISGSYIDGIGNVREVPPNSQTSSYTLQATDSGKYISITTGGVTVPPSIFSVGQTISIYNNSSSNQIITQGGGVTLRLVASTTTGNLTLAGYGVATILCVASNTFVVTGGGLS
jgi:hypothetical protein